MGIRGGARIRGIGSVLLTPGRPFGRACAACCLHYARRHAVMQAYSAIWRCPMPEKKPEPEDAGAIAALIEHGVGPHWLSGVVD